MAEQKPQNIVTEYKFVSQPFPPGKNLFSVKIENGHYSYYDSKNGKIENCDSEKLKKFIENINKKVEEDKGKDIDHGGNYVEGVSEGTKTIFLSQQAVIEVFEWINAIIKNKSKCFSLNDVNNNEKQEINSQ